VNGPHDLGGAHGFGPVVAEADEPIFHAPWEPRALALVLATGGGGRWNLDMVRFARESIPPARYLASSYYDIWATAFERMLVEHGMVTATELATGHATEPAAPDVRVLAAADVSRMLSSRNGSTERPATDPARFGVGERVRARVMHPRGHTRLPRYVRGHIGAIESVHGVHVYPDHHAHGGGEDPQWLYTVVFDGRELWGDDGDPTTTVSVDAFEPYLEPLEP
jgi:nitrile hydratase beta subunit